jgi:hypothetical protein
MAFINKEKTALIRAALKKEFPECRFSVSFKDFMSLTVAVTKSPFFETNTGSKRVNQYYINEHYKGEQKVFLNKINDIIKDVGEWYNRSDAMTDYFDTAFYYDIRIGSYTKGHTKI